MQLIRPLFNNNLQIPLVFFPVSAGFPSPADDYIDKKIDLNSYLIEHPSATYFVKVAGDSMSGKGIFSGDLVVVDKSIEAKDGHIIIAALNGEFTIKELKKQSKTKFMLKSANKTYPDIHITESDNFEIFGVVISVIRKL